MHLPIEWTYPLRRDDSDSGCSNSGSDGNSSDDDGGLDSGFGSGADSAGSVISSRRRRRRSCSSGNNSSSDANPPLDIGTGNTTMGFTRATPYGSGINWETPGQIPDNFPFAGRLAGAWNRAQIYGSRTYGSGYGGEYDSSIRGVTGRGFPFFFWPVIWGPAPGNWSTPYLYDEEFGDVSNSSRPGGALKTVSYESGTGNATFRIIADNATSASLLLSINTNCTSYLNPNMTGTRAVADFNLSDPSAPSPEEAVQYYRASSIVLTLDGYNDSVALNASAHFSDRHTHLPSWVDRDLMQCLNLTIGTGAPLVTNDASQVPPGVTSNSMLAASPADPGIVGLFTLFVLIFAQFL